MMMASRAGVPLCLSISICWMVKKDVGAMESGRPLQKAWIRVYGATWVGTAWTGMN